MANIKVTIFFNVSTRQLDWEVNCPLTRFMCLSQRQQKALMRKARLHYLQGKKSQSRLGTVMNEFVRRKMNEEGIMRKLIPPILMPSILRDEEQKVLIKNQLNEEVHE